MKTAEQYADMMDTDGWTLDDVIADAVSGFKRRAIEATELVASEQEAAHEYDAAAGARLAVEALRNVLA